VTQTPVRKLAVLLHADVVGSTSLVQENETLAHERILDTFQRFSEAISNYGGIAHEIRGDALVSEFSRASDAVGASLSFQAANTTHNEQLSDDIRPVLRIGIAMGEVVVADNTVTGEGVVLAQRLEQLAEPGGIRIQGAAYETLPKRLPFKYDNLGEQQVKGFDEPVKLYAVSLKPGAAVPEPELLSQTSTATLDFAETPAIAVLPFTNTGDDPDQEHFSDGITEDILTALSRISGLLVVARNSTMIYKDKAVDIKQVGREQSVGYVLEGSVRKSGDRIRVTAQLIDAITGHHLWAENYDRKLGNIFRVQDEITKNVTTELQLHLPQGEDVRVWTKGADPLRIFVSSPGDVNEERVVTARVIERLKTEFAHQVPIEPIYWEHESLLAAETSQAQITKPSEADIAVVILWSRLGTRLPPQLTADDESRYASGTAFEFEDALAGWRENGRPELLVYRKTSRPDVVLQDKQAMLRGVGQQEALDEFVTNWFQDHEEGAPGTAFHTFEQVSEIENLVEVHLRKLIEQRAPVTGTGEAVNDVTVTWTDESPFRGLEVFDTRHAPIFFGRTQATSEAIHALRKQAAEGRAFVAVLGMSGVGKSSLVRAGVVPLLTQPGVIEGIGLWRRALFRPSDTPGDLIGGLANALLSAEALPELGADGTTSQALDAILRKQPDTVDLLIKGGLSQAAAAYQAEHKLLEQPQARLLLVLDPFEELFSDKSIDAEQRRSFIELLSALAGGGRVWMIATLRSDFYPRCAEEPELVRLMKGAGQHLLTPPSRVEIGQMIRLPAIAAGLRFEQDANSQERLDEVIRDAAVKSPESVALLEFTLEELYRRRTDAGVLTFQAYADIGGVEGALGERAESLYLGLRKSQRSVVESIFRALVTLNPGETEIVTAQRMPLASLSGDELRREVLDAFIGARLLVTDSSGANAGVVSIVHEALIHNWPRFHQWLEADREHFRVRARVSAAAIHWIEEGELEELLLHEGRSLAEAEELLGTRREELEEEVIRFVETSLAAQRRAQADAEAQTQRRLRRTRALATVFAALAIGAGIGGYFGYQGQQIAEQQTSLANQQQEIAEIERATTLRTQSLFLASLSGAETEAGNATNGMLLALEALPGDLSSPDRPYVVEAESALYRAVVAHREKLNLNEHEGGVTRAAFSPDGQLLVTASSDHTARLWDVTSGQVLLVLGAHTDSVLHAAFSPDGQQVVTASRDDTARLWDVTGGKALAVLEGHGNRVNYAAFSPDGARIVTASWDSTARLWDVTSGEALGVLKGHRLEVNHVAFSSDGEHLVTSSEDRTARLWDVTSGKVLLVLGAHEYGINYAAFSPDGQQLVTTSWDDTARLWDVTSGQALVVLRGHAGDVHHAAFSPDGERVVTTSVDNTARLWDVASGEALVELRGHEYGINHAAFSPDGQQVVTASRDDTARLWDVTSGQVLLVLGAHTDSVLHAAFSPDGQLLVTASSDHTARLWDVTSGQAIAVLEGHEKRVLNVAFSPDGRRVVTASEDHTARLWDVVSGEAIAVLGEHAGNVNHATFSPDGKRVVTASNDGTARLWNILTAEGQSLIDHARQIVPRELSPEERKRFFLE